MTYTQKIADNLTLRSLQDEGDKAHFATFNAIYNVPEEGRTCTCLLNHHPQMTSMTIGSWRTTLPTKSSPRPV